MFGRVWRSSGVTTAPLEVKSWPGFFRMFGLPVPKPLDSSVAALVAESIERSEACGYTALRGVYAGVPRALQPQGALQLPANRRCVCKWKWNAEGRMCRQHFWHVYQFSFAFYHLDFPPKQIEA